MYKFKFADIGEGLHEGLVSEIYFKEGDKIKEGDSLFSVETDKVTSDIPSPVSGVIKKILMTQGDTIHVGQEIFYIDDGSGDSAQTPAQSAPATPAAKPVEQEVAAPAKSSGSASVVGEVSVNDDIIDFSSFGSAPTKVETPHEPEYTPEVEVEAAQEQQTESAVISSYTGEKGKEYNGKIEEEFDVIIIGSGPGGYLAAEEAGKSGLKTMIVERWAWGGVCLNTGCIPTKALLKSTKIISEFQGASKYGLVANLDKIKINKEETWKGIHKRKEEVISRVSSSVKMLMKSSKVKIMEGDAKFVGAREVEVNGKVYRTKNLIIATGSRPRKLDMIPGFKEGYESGLVVTSREAINHSHKLPKSIVIIGGGVIGVEFSQIFALSGSKVTLLQNSDRIIPMTDIDVSKEAAKSLELIGVEIIYNAQTIKLDKKTLHYSVDGENKKISAELILTATGRKPNSEGLSEVGIKIGEHGQVLVDNHLRTNVQGVYAIGDVVGQSMLAHVAYAHALSAVLTILESDSISRYNPKGIPGCIYVTPEISFIGLTEQEAKKAGNNVLISKYAFEYLGKSVASKETQGFVKLIVDKEYGEILGASIVGPHSTDYIAQIAIVMEQEISVHEIAHTIHPHPTYSEIIWEAARSASLKLMLEKRKKK